MTGLYFAAPWWLLVPVLGLGLFFLKVNEGLPGAWPDIVSRRLHGIAGQWLIGGGTPKSRLARWLLCLLLGGALADIRIGQTNVAPLRNLHARYLVIDVSSADNFQQPIFVGRQLAASAAEIPTGVIAVAADAYDVVPLTTDSSQLDRYLKVLAPEIMPKPGRRLELGVRRAEAAFKRSGITVGQIVVLAAGSAPPQRLQTSLSPAATIWLVTGVAASGDWKDYAERLGANLLNVDKDKLTRLDNEIKREQERAIRDSTPVQERRSISPWLALACLPGWLLVFFRARRQ
ncbi:MAG: VWA domain-containing protein [Burkholderiaceae bacterium]